MGVGGIQVARTTREWSPPWWDIMGVGGFDTLPAHRWVYARLVHGIATSPTHTVAPWAHPWAIS